MNCVHIIGVHPVIPRAIEWELRNATGDSFISPISGDSGQERCPGPGKAIFLVPTHPRRPVKSCMAQYLQSIDFQLQNYE